MRIITWVCSNVVQVECLLGGIETFCHALLSDKNKNQHISLQNTKNGHNGKRILLWTLSTTQVRSLLLNQMQKEFTNLIKWMQRSSHHFTRLLNASKYNNTNNKLMVQS